MKLNSVSTNFNLLKTSDMTPVEKLIYIYIKNTGTNTKHSIKHISENLSIGEKSVQRYLQSLERKGILERKYQHPVYKYYLLKNY